MTNETIDVHWWEVEIYGIWNGDSHKYFCSQQVVQTLKNEKKNYLLILRVWLYFKEDIQICQIFFRSKHRCGSGTFRVDVL